MHRRRLTSRRSPVHGRGVFALQAIAAGERLIEYTGEVTNWRRVAARQRADDGHTFVFGLSDGRMIDGSRRGNSARFINYACAPAATDERLHTSVKRPQRVCACVIVPDRVPRCV